MKFDQVGARVLGLVEMRDQVSWMVESSQILLWLDSMKFDQVSSRPKMTLKHNR